MQGVVTRKVTIEPWSVVEYSVPGSEGPPVVLIHGLAGSFEWWRRNVAPLAKSHEVSGIDLPGFGAERGLVSAPSPLPLEESASLLGRWIESRFEGPVHLVGHSMGGQISIELAAARPDLVQTLTLISTSGLSVTRTPRHLMRSLLPPRGFFSFIPRLGLDIFRAGPSAIARAGVDLLRKSSEEAMRRLARPVLVIWGSRDQLLPPSYGTAVHETIDGSRLEIIEGAGHLPMWEAAEETNRLLLDFFADSTRSEQQRAARVRTRRLSWVIQGCRDGICWRGVASSPDVVLIHGLGIRTRYFGKLAAELYARDIRAAAPDLPGFGESWEREAWSVDEITGVIARWARSVGVSDAVWVGHSVGAQVVRRIELEAPELVSASLHVAPIWSSSRPSFLQLAWRIARDALREPWGLIIEAVSAYWESGLGRFLKAFRGYAADLDRKAELDGANVLAGTSDPLVDLDHLESAGADVELIEGAHGVVWSNPAGVADAIERRIDSARPRGDAHAE